MKPKDELIVSAVEPAGLNRKKVWMQKGKNLFNYNDVVKIFPKVTVLENTKNSVKVSTTGDYARVEVTLEKLLANKQYTIQTEIVNTSGSNAGLYYDSTVSDTKTDTAFKSIITATSDESGNLSFYLYANRSASTTAYEVQFNNIQVEQGSTATDYEEYIEPKIYIKNDNNVYEEFININNLDIYSTGEKVIGKWINGKNLYRKVVSFGQLPNSTSKAVTHNIDNLELVVDIKAVSKNTSSTFFPLIFASNTLAGNISLYVDGTNIVITTGSDRTAFTTTFVIIEYTKSID